MMASALLCLALAAGLLAWSPAPASGAAWLKLRLAALEGLGVRLQGLGVRVRIGRLALAGALAGAMTAFLLIEGPFSAAVGAVLGAAAPWAWAGLLERRRLAKAGGQLGGLLEPLASALRAGQSFEQAFQTAAAEAPEPLAGFLRPAAGALRLGQAPELALEGLSEAFRASPALGDWRMLATAVGVTRSTGGNLAEILDGLGESVRERQRLRAQVEAMTAQGKLSAWIVGLLPVALLLALQVLDPALVAPLFNTGKGLALLAGGLALELVGLFLLKRIVDVDA